MSDRHIIGLIERRLGRHVLLHAAPTPDEDRVVVARHHLMTVLAFLQRDPDTDLDLLVDLCCVDHGLGMGRPRFEVIFRLRSSRLPYRLLLTVPVPNDDASIPSATALYPVANWYEREMYDLFGIFCDGHPYLRRLILYPGFEGHPGRRDYPATKPQPLIALKRIGEEPIVIDDKARAAPAIVEEGP
jgi:NADH-quinone oxidoreductase subunit C